MKKISLETGPHLISGSGWPPPPPPSSEGLDPPLWMTVNVFFPQYSRCLIQTVSFFYQKYTKLGQILGLKHLLIYIVSVISVEACFVFRFLLLICSPTLGEKSQTVRRLGLLSHFDCHEIGVRWRIFWLVSPRAHENWNHNPKIS